MVVFLSAFWGIRLICSVVGACFSAFYAWRRGATNTSKLGDEVLGHQVRLVFEAHKRRYGSRRICAELRASGHSVSRRQVAALMRRQQLKAIQPRSFVPRTTNSKGVRRSDNLLLDRPESKRPGEVLIGDITYIPLKGGRFAYLAIWQDMHTRQIVGWELAMHMRSSLVINALKKALGLRKYAKGLIVHSDGGGQYDADDFRRLLNAEKFLSSMARKDNHYDNAMAESFFSRIKAELLENGLFDCFEDAYTEIFDYMEVYYNSKRRHSSLNYLTPDEYEQDWERRYKRSKNLTEIVV